MQAAVLSDIAIALVSAGSALLGSCVGAYATIKARPPFRQELAVSQARVLLQLKMTAFADLLPLTAYGSEDLSLERRQERARKMTAWYYEGGNGLLLSGTSMGQFVAARAALENPQANSKGIREALSLLRTDLKIELGVREPGERDTPYAPSEKDAW
jgi:hypothetical protein